MAVYGIPMPGLPGMMGMGLNPYDPLMQLQQAQFGPAQAEAFAALQQSGDPFAGGVNGPDAPQRPNGIWGRLAQGLLPGSGDLSPTDQRALVNQGLLAAGLGILANNNKGGNAGAAVGSGITQGLLAMNKASDQLADNRYRKAYMERQLGDPASLRERNALLEDAIKDLPPEEQDRIRRESAQVALAVKARPSSAGYKFSVVDHNGVPRQQRDDPRTGQTVVWVQEIGQYVPLEQMQEYGQGVPGVAPPSAQPQGGGGDSGGWKNPSDIYTLLRPAVERAESNGNPNAVSPKGAMGRMQVMPGTASAPGFGITPARDRSDAELTRVGEEYLQALVTKYGDPRAALAAYNWGPDNVDRTLSQVGGNVDRMLAMAPEETRTYVPRVLNFARQQSMSQPNLAQQYGLGRGRTKEAEEYATTAARQQAELDFLRQRNEIQTDADVNRTQRTALTQQGTDEYKSIRERASAATMENRRLDELERLLSQVRTGPGANAILNLSKFGAMLGLADASKVGAGEAARALSNQLALGLRNPAGGEGMPGAMSDADRAFLQQSIAGIENTEGGWQQMLQFRRRLNSYAIQQARAAREFMRDGGDAADLDWFMQVWADSNPLFAGNGGQPGSTVAGGYAPAPADQTGAAPGGVKRFNPATGRLE